MFDQLDGLVLPGGPDPHPSAWGEPVHPATVVDEARDRLEYALLAGCIDAVSRCWASVEASR